MSNIKIMVTGLVVIQWHQCALSFQIFAVAVAPTMSL